MQWIPFLLMIGAFGKSAQFPLYVWLPDAMEGPTPVSALIHAATMVTAGVYMIARCGTLFVTNSAAMTTIAAIGCFTALLAATIALRQFDLKKVFAYSTISQLGFMFVACRMPRSGGRRVPPCHPRLLQSAAVPLLRRRHARDGRRTGHAENERPRNASSRSRNIVMLIGCLALAGFPLTSGFFSKDEIVAAAFARSRFSVHCSSSRPS